MLTKSAVEEASMHELGLAHMFVRRELDTFYQDLAARFHVTSIEWLILGVIAEETPVGGIRVTDLASKFRVKTTYITMVLHNLRLKSYVETRFDDSDARVRLTVISKQGAKQLRTIERYAHQATLKHFKGLVETTEFERYTAVLLRLAQLR